MYLLNNNNGNNISGLSGGVIGAAGDSTAWGGLFNGQPLASQNGQPIAQGNEGTIGKRSPIPQDGTRTPIVLNDCPQTCSDQVQEETWYLTDTNCPDCIPVNSITETSIECDDPAPIPPQRKIDCNDVVSALRARGMNIDFAGGTTPGNGIYGLNDSFNLSGCGCSSKGLGNSGSEDNSDYNPYGGGSNPADSSGNSGKNGFTAAGFLGLPNWLLLMSAGSLITYLGIKYFGSK